MTPSLAAAKDLRMGAVVLSELDGVFTLKEEQRAALKAFLLHLPSLASPLQMFCMGSLPGGLVR